MQTVATINGREIKGMVFRSLASARSAAYVHAAKPLAIIMGDCPQYWVVTPADASRLERAGYEWIS